MKISLFNNIWHTSNGSEIPVDHFLDYIREGKWQDYVLPIRTIKSYDERTEAKKKVPYVTLSGIFSERTDTALSVHSGIIGIDIDEVDPEEVKLVLKDDPYVYAYFTSISGVGLCVLFRINGDKHRQLFNGISEYLFNTYGLVVDPTSVNPSRARFVSFDPHLFVNEKAKVFTYIPKVKEPPKGQTVIFVQSDFDEIINEISQRRVNICGNYHEWLNVAFALCDKFGESGRSYFQVISQVSGGFRPDSQAANPKLTDRQYTNCLKRSRSGITIATFYYYAKNAGIATVSQKTKTITQAAYYAKKGARDQESAIQYLADAEGIQANESAAIVEEVFRTNIAPPSDNHVEAVEAWIKQNYSLRRNVITRYVESNGTQIQTTELNSIYIAAKKIFEKGITFELITKIIYSDFTPDFNPFLEFFDKYKDRRPTGAIAALFNTIHSDTGISGAEFFPEFKTYFGTRWIVGLVSAAHGHHSPLMLVLSGNVQGTGKTEWFRRLLPDELKKYYAESKLDAGKDDEILMTQKLLIMDDEMGGKNKKESKRLKELTSKQTFSLREPYGQSNVDLHRLAVLCGTTNDNEILSDPTGNRRTIPINVISIDHAAYNAIDKIDVLMEAYHLFKDGFAWRLTKDDVRILNENTGYFEQPSPEYELVTAYMKLPKVQAKGFGVEHLLTTVIKSRLEIATRQVLNINRIGQEMKKLGWIKREHMGKFGYFVIWNNSDTADTGPTHEKNSSVGGNSYDS